MSKQSFRYKNVVVGYRPSVNPDVRENLLKAARYDGTAHRAESLEDRAAAFDLKNYHLARAFHLDSRMFILAFEGGYVGFHSKVGYPSFSRGLRRTVIHVPTKQLMESPRWRQSRGMVCHLAGLNAGKTISVCKSRQLWPEDTAKRKRTPTPRLSPHNHRRRSALAPALT